MGMVSLRAWGGTAYVPRSPSRLGAFGLWWGSRHRFIRSPKPGLGRLTVIGLVFTRVLLPSVVLIENAKYCGFDSYVSLAVLGSLIRHIIRQLLIAAITLVTWCCVKKIYCFSVNPCRSLVRIPFPAPTISCYNFLTIVAAQTERLFCCSRNRNPGATTICSDMNLTIWCWLLLESNCLWGTYSYHWRCGLGCIGVRTLIFVGTMIFAQARSTDKEQGSWGQAT